MKKGNLKSPLEFLLSHVRLSTVLHGYIREQQCPLVNISPRTSAPLLFMRVVSYSETRRKITHLYSLSYCLVLFQLLLWQGWTNVSKELSAPSLRIQWTGQMTEKKEKDRESSILNIQRHGYRCLRVCGCIYVYTYIYMHIPISICLYQPIYNQSSVLLWLGDKTTGGKVCRLKDSEKSALGPCMTSFYVTLENEPQASHTSHRHTKKMVPAWKAACEFLMH
jgi:hypothetical protein